VDLGGPGGVSAVRERCIRLFVPTVRKNVKYRLCRLKAGPSIAGIVYRSTGSPGSKVINRVSWNILPLFCFINKMM